MVAGVRITGIGEGFQFFRELSFSALVLVFRGKIAYLGAIIKATAFQLLSYSRIQIYIKASLQNNDFGNVSIVDIFLKNNSFSVYFSKNFTFTF